MRRTLLLAVALLALAGAATTSTLLSRIDTATAEARTAYAHVRLLRAELAREKAAARYMAPERDPAVDVCLRRTEALRGAIFALVKTGAVSMPGDPGGEWVTWR